MRRLILLVLTGCSTAYTAEAPVAFADVASLTPIATDSPATGVTGLAMAEPLDVDRMETDAEYAAQVLEAAVEHIRTLPEPERATITDAMSMLVANCPYTRAKVMVTLALERQLMAMNTSSLSVDGQARFAQALRGVQAQASFYKVTGVDDLPMPLPSDFLASPQTVDGRTFVASDNPIGLSMMALEQVDAALSNMPSATQESIREAWDVVEPHTGNTIVFNFIERHTRNALGWLVKKEEVANHPDGLFMARSVAEELGTHGC